MKTSPKSLLCACVFLWLTGAAANVSAQSVTILPVINIIRTYTGTATQTSATGGMTTGTCTVTLDDLGHLAGVVVLNGITTNYYGVLSRSKLGEKRTSGSGYFQALKLVPLPAGGVPVTGGTPIVGGVVSIVVPEKVPVVVTAKAAYGGMLNADGSSLVFRGSRTTETTGN